jgi:hypothetical protein
MQEILNARRDQRIDVLRGLALIMIFIDHIPGNQLGFLTLHVFGFADAAEIFVLFAGFASMLAYGRVMLREGILAGMRRAWARCGRVYVTHVLLLLSTIAVARAWESSFHVAPLSVAPLLDSGWEAFVHGLMLNALPPYLDILPLYVVLLAGFPLLFLVMRWSRWCALAGAVLLWLAATFEPQLNFPNWLDPAGWYFDPFAWQLLFVLGAALALHMARQGGNLRPSRFLNTLCWLYLALAFVESFPTGAFGLPPIKLIPMPAPDKTHLSILRVLNILAWVQIIFSSERTRRWAGHRLAWALDICGRHSLEVFALGCVLGLLGRLVLHTFGTAIPLQVAINVVGVSAMIALAAWLERGSRHGARAGASRLPAGAVSRAPPPRA